MTQCGCNAVFFMKFWKEFKAFISRGNIVDLAIGVIIGTAFNKIVTENKAENGAKTVGKNEDR